MQRPEMSSGAGARASAPQSQPAAPVSSPVGAGDSRPQRPGRRPASGDALSPAGVNKLIDTMERLVSEPIRFSGRATPPSLPPVEAAEPATPSDPPQPPAQASRISTNPTHEPVTPAATARSHEPVNPADATMSTVDTGASTVDTSSAFDIRPVDVSATSNVSVASSASGVSSFSRKQLKQRMQAEVTPPAPTTGSHQRASAPAVRTYSPRTTAAAHRLSQHGELKAAAIAKVRADVESKALSECTFRPTIHESPTPASERPPRDTSVPIEVRLNALGRKAAEDRALLRRDTNQEATKECTFRPEINPARRTASAHRHVDTESPRSHEAILEAYNELEEQLPPWEPADYVPVVARTTQSRVCHILGTDWKQDLDDECTFQPHIGPLSETVYVVNRIAEGSMDVFDRLYSRSLAAKGKGLQDGGGPEVNLKMYPTVSATAMLPEVAVGELKALRERLGAVPNPGTDELKAFFDNVLGRMGDNRAPAVREEEPVDAAAQDEEDSRRSSARQAKIVSFSQFLARQNDLELNRRRHVAELEKEVFPPAIPQICANTKAILSEKSQSGSVSVRRPYRPELQYTFKPVINDGHRNQPRGFKDMLKDAQRKERALKQKKEQCEAKSMESCTFAPQLSSAAASGKFTNVQSMLSQKNLGRYLEQVTSHQQRKRNLEESRKQHDDEAETSECTFRPAIHGVPAYIPRMVPDVSS